MYSPGEFRSGSRSCVGEILFPLSQIVLDHANEFGIPSVHVLARFLHAGHDPKEVGKAGPFDVVCPDTLLLAFFVEEIRLLIRRIVGHRRDKNLREKLDVRVEQRGIEWMVPSWGR